MNLPYSNPKRRTREELFFEFYARLLDWASQLVHHDQAEAEDLVHDLYIQFVRVDRTVEKIENLEAYLFTTLRNLHYSRRRRAGHNPINDFSIVDYDSVELGLAAVDRRQLLFVRSNLKQICRYVCHRKGAARSASILILRFFFGYYPSEVMKVTQSSRMAVDRSLQLARKEARQNLDRPNAVQPIAPGKEISVSFAAESDDSENLFTQLRQAIFSSCEGECFTEGLLEQRYADESKPGFTTPELAHLVSCRLCLDRANCILDLPLLSERSPEDALDHDTHSNSDGNGPTGAAGPGRLFVKKTRQRQRLEHRVRQLFEHRPASLQIAVNGEIRASQIVTSEISELYLKLGRPEEPAFIEVLSEQGFCLLLLQVAEPVSTAELEQVESCVFSDNRSMTLKLSFSAEGPIVYVLYLDPVMAGEPLAHSITGPDSNDAVMSTESSARTTSLHPRSRVLREAERAIAFLSKGFRRFFFDMMNPMLATSLVCGVVAIILFALSVHSSSVIKPKELMTRAAAAEVAPQMSGQIGVAVQAVRIQTSRLRVERTVYRDVQGHRHPKPKPVPRDDERLASALALAGVSWDDPLSPAGFGYWHDRAKVQQETVKRTGDGLLTLTTTVAGGDVVSESLTVRATDFHTVGKAIQLRDQGLIEIAEVSYGVIPWSSINPDIFDPLISASEAEGRHPHAALLPHLPPVVTPPEMDLAELSARLVLNRLGLDANSRIEISRSADGVHVHGVVDTTTQKNQLQTELRLVPHVLPSILTVEEMADNTTRSAAVTSIQAASDVAQAPSSLERYFAGRGLGQQELSPVAQGFLESSFAVKRETAQVDTLLQRFSANSALSNESRIALNELLVQHKTALLAALGREERVLMAAHLTEQPSNTAVSTESVAESLRKHAEENFALCVELTSDNKSTPRPAEAIAQQLAESIAELRAAALRISTAELSLPPSPGGAGLANKNY